MSTGSKHYDPLIEVAPTPPKPEYGFERCLECTTFPCLTLGPMECYNMESKNTEDDFEDALDMLCLGKSRAAICKMLGFSRTENLVYNLRNAGYPVDKIFYKTSRGVNKSWADARKREIEKQLNIKLN